MGAPAVSVIIPAYDAEATILETIASVRVQTHVPELREATSATRR